MRIVSELSTYRMHRNIRQEKIFATWPKFYKFLSFIKDCIEDMVTFTMLVKCFSTKFFCSTKVAGLGEIYKSRIQYNNFDLGAHILSGLITRSWSCTVMYTA